MPRISQFYGIDIEMYYNDHTPAHFHAYYGEHEVEVSITSIEILKGKLPNRAWRLVREWALLNQTALADNWERARAQESLQRIEGLQ